MERQPRAHLRGRLSPARLPRCGWLLSLLPLAPGEPFAGLKRACYSGQLCTVSGVVGTGLGDGDRLLLATATCGLGPKVPGMPGALGESLPALGRGSSMTWPTHITPDGGDYKLCWCSAGDSCVKVNRYSLEIGTLTVTGPVSGLVTGCTSGRHCIIDGISGIGLRNGDSLMVLDACGGHAVDGFPNGAKTTTGNQSGSSHGWGLSRISAAGGTYALCWCAQGATCIGSRHHRTPLGTLELTGPSGSASHVCNVFQECTWNGLGGFGLQDGDKIMLLEECGLGPPIEGFPNGDMAVASNNGHDYAFSTTGEIITPGGGAYAMCWCGTRSYSQCSSPDDFMVRAGTLTVQGPRRDHRVSCVQGNACQVSGLRGMGLATTDRIQVRISCTSSTSAPQGFPDSGMASPMDSVSNYTEWAAPVTAAFGNFRLCWCGLGWTCDWAGFKMDAGELRVVGIDTGQQRECHVLAGCQVSNINGNGLRAGDKLMIRVSCDINGGQVPGWLSDGVSDPATSSGTGFSWGLANRVEAEPGIYQMCWCPVDYYKGCDNPSDFTVEVGEMHLKGPTRLSRDATCVARQSPSCRVGPFLSGHRLAQLVDRVGLIGVEQTCGVDPLDAQVGGATIGEHVQSDGLVHLPAEALPEGGIWKMCYCTNYDSPLDSDTVPCSSNEDFPGEAGLIYVRGAFSNQGINCTRNQECTFSIVGYNLNKDTNMIALRDDSTTCGSNTLFEDATRDRRALTGNPYRAATRVSDGELTFTVGFVQALMTFRICYCVPVPGSGQGGCNMFNLGDFVQEVGFLDIRGALAGQAWECGTGGHCTIVVFGRHLGIYDRVKVVKDNETCAARAEDHGFFRPLAPADPAPITTETAATFALGRVTATGNFKVCYCAALGGCDGMDEYNHAAGVLQIVNPLTSINFVTATAASITVAANSSITNADSRVRCATSIYEPRSIPNTADIQEGLAVVGLGKGEAVEGTVRGMNAVEMFFKTFVRSRQPYRVWCVETSAQSFVMPEHPYGVLIMATDGIQIPRATTYPTFLWTQADFHIELFQVYDESVDTSQAVTAVRVGSAPSESMCNRLPYANAYSMHVADRGQPGTDTVVLLSDQPLRASRWQRFVCFFAGPNSTGIAMVSDRLHVQEEVPSFWQRLVSGQEMKYFYRGVLMQVVLQDTASSNGLLHWTMQTKFTTEACASAKRTLPPAQLISGANTGFFRLSDMPGKYTMCYLGSHAEAGTSAPLNGIGDFEVVDVITVIRQHPTLPSTRSTARIEVEVRLPGTVICLVRDGPADVRPEDFAGGQSFAGLASLVIGPPPPSIDPEYPRSLSLTIPLVSYQRSAGPLLAWCRHSAAESLVFPESTTGALVPLQVEEAHAHTDPPYIWHGARFLLRLSGTPHISTKQASVHEPALPAGWRKEFITEDGARKLKYISGVLMTEEHPVYTRWRNGIGPSPCEDCDTSQAKAISAEDYTRTESWFQANAAGPFVCYWAMPSAFPHIVTILDIPAQEPTFQLEVEGQVQKFVYRGVSTNILLQHGSPLGGRLLVVHKAAFDSFGGSCQAFPAPLRQMRVGDPTAVSAPQSAAPRREQATTPGSCTRKPRGTANLRFAAVEDLFPADEWGDDTLLGLNCSKDFKLYHHPNVANISVLANVHSGVYILVTSSESALLHLLPNVGVLSPSGTVPSGDEALVYQGFTALSEYTASNQWAFSAKDCAMQELLSPASPSYEEGAEDLPLSQSLQAALELKEFDFAALLFLPSALTVIRRDSVCKILQPPAPPPKREETVFDIDKPGLGRTVVGGRVWVPSRANDTGTFLHRDRLGVYVVCYIGLYADDHSHSTRRLNHLSKKHTTLEYPIFNPIGAPFSMRDVLSPFAQPADHGSDSARGFLSVASELQGLIRCIALLRNVNPPKDPDDIFHPHLGSEDYVGSSDLVNFSVSGLHKVVMLHLDQVKAKLIAPMHEFIGAPPTMYVWCAHESSTVLYPDESLGYALSLEARHPPAFEYRQLNRSIAELTLTLELQFTSIVVYWKDPLFPVNQYDEVRFTVRPTMPNGLQVDPRTGIISGVPKELASSEVRNIAATSLYPPYSQSSVDVMIHVDDVLGLRYTHANAEGVTLTVRPRTTDVFQPTHIFLLIRKKTVQFTKRPEEFFCIDALQSVPFSNSTALDCREEQDSCCCAGFVLPHVPVQDARINAKDCGLEAKKQHHTRGMVQGLLRTVEDVKVPARLASTFTADFVIPAEAPPEEKSPVLFDLIILTPFEEYLANQDQKNRQLLEELKLAINITQDLVRINKAVSSKGDVDFELSFYVEARCLEEVSTEVKMISFGIDIRQGCSFVSPTEYMEELKVQLSNTGSALLHRDDLKLLRQVSVERSFSNARVMHFCSREPLWEYGSVVTEASECPLDSMKIGALGLVGGTIALMLMLAFLSFWSRECMACSRFAKTRFLDILTPLLALYTVLADYGWLVMLRMNRAHPLHDLFFTASLIHLGVCFVLNLVALRFTITTHIMDTPWWRRNRKRLRLVLLLSGLTPRFFRVTRSFLFGLDRLSIHFGTPSKMAIVFSNLGLMSLIQDIPQLLIQVYVWLIWRNASPKVSLLCFALGAQSILTAALHHIFSRSQRAAYERVVKLLGLRRLTAGFFDVSSGVQQAQLDSMRRADGTGAFTRKEEQENALPQGEDLDPEALDPVQAALYVSRMYDHEVQQQTELNKSFSDLSEGAEILESVGGDSEDGAEDPLNDNGPWDKVSNASDSFAPAGSS